MQRLGYGAELMGGIKLTIAVLEVMYSAMSVFASETYLVSEVMLIAPLHMHNFAENALTHHTQKSHFVAVIAAVFKKHAELAGLFGSPDELPAFLDRRCSADFHGDMLACSHAVDRYAGMGYPSSCDHNSLDIVAL